MVKNDGPGIGLRLGRRVWTYLTFLLALPILLPAFVLIAVYAAVKSIGHPRGWWLGVRLTIMQLVLGVFVTIMQTSTRLFNRLLGRALYIRSPFERIRPELLIVGHRGSPTETCENTLPSFARAIAQGANAIELDLCFTQDNAVVIWHDWDPNDAVAIFREAGLEAHQHCKPFFGDGEFRRPVTELTLAELRQHCGFLERVSGAALRAGQGEIPTWRAFLEVAKTWPGLRTVFLDMKIPPAAVAYAAPMMTRIQADIAAVCPHFECVVMTIYPEVLEAMKAAAPDMTYCFDKEFPPILQDPSPEFIEARSTIKDALRLQHPVASVGRPTFLALSPWELYKSVLSHDLRLRHASDTQPQLIAWTINDPDELRWLINSGVDGILTDQPGLLARLELRRKAVLLFLHPLRPQT
jgi:glycerophosphoryl diester phosphodiesterase